MSIYIAGEDLRNGDLVMNYLIDSNYVLKYDKNFKFKKGEYLNFTGVVVRNEEHIPCNPFREKDSSVNVHSFGKIWIDIPKDVEFKNDDLVYVNKKNQVMIAPKGIDERCCIGHIVGDKKWDVEINSTDNIMILKIDTRKYKGWTTDFAEMISEFKESTKNNKLKFKDVREANRK